MSNPIFMMNDLKSFKFSSKMFFHNESMVELFIFYNLQAFFLSYSISSIIITLKYFFKFRTPFSNAIIFSTLHRANIALKNFCFYLFVSTHRNIKKFFAGTALKIFPLSSKGSAAFSTARSCSPPRRIVESIKKFLAILVRTYSRKYSHGESIIMPIFRTPLNSFIYIHLFSPIKKSLLLLTKAEAFTAGIEMDNFGQFVNNLIIQNRGKQCV